MTDGDRDRTGRGRGKCCPVETLRPEQCDRKHYQVAKGVAAPSHLPVCDSNAKSSSDRSFDEQVGWQVWASSLPAIC